MNKTYVTTLPDHVGAFLQASRCLTDLGVNMTRRSIEAVERMRGREIDWIETPPDTVTA